MGNTMAPVEETTKNHSPTVPGKELPRVYLWLDVATRDALSTDETKACINNVPWR